MIPNHKYKALAERFTPICPTQLAKLVCSGRGKAHLQ